MHDLEKNIEVVFIVVSRKELISLFYTRTHMFLYALMYK